MGSQEEEEWVSLVLLACFACCTTAILFMPICTSLCAFCCTLVNVCVHGLLFRFLHAKLLRFLFLSSSIFAAAISWLYFLHFLHVFFFLVAQTEVRKKERKPITSPTFLFSMREACFGSCIVCFWVFCCIVGFGDDRLDGECPCCFGLLQFGSWEVSEALFYSLSLSVSLSLEGKTFRKV